MNRACYLLFVWGCKNENFASGNLYPKPTATSSAVPEEKKSTPNPNPETNPDISLFKGMIKDICGNPPDSPQQKKAIEGLSQYKPGSAPMSSFSFSTKDQCVEGLKLPAIYVNLISGVPAGTLIGQAVQETGFCTSVLAKEAFNFHGMKSDKVTKSQFTFWDGSSMKKSSTESTTGSGNNVVSSFMKFSHPDFSFYSVAERFLISSLPYVKCLPGRDNVESFMVCIGKSWAVHTEYAQSVLKHRKDYKLDSCEIPKSQWKLDSKWKL